MKESEIKILKIANVESDIKQLLELAEELQRIGSKYGFNVFQPGAMKELKMAYILQHDWIQSKKNADACDREDSNILFEYLSGTENGAGQIDRVFKDNPDKEEQHNKYLQSMERIERNKYFFLAYTNSNTSLPLDILRIYKVSPSAIRKETDAQLRNSRNDISHVAFDEVFAKQNGVLVWEKDNDGSLE